MLANFRTDRSCADCRITLKEASRLIHELNAGSQRTYAFYARQEASRRSSAMRLLWLMLTVGAAADAGGRKAAAEAALMQVALSQSEKLRAISSAVEPNRAALEQEHKREESAASVMADLLAVQSAIQLSSSAALVSVDTDFVITSWNPAAESLFGYSASEVIGHMKPEQLQDPQGPRRLPRAWRKPSRYLKRVCGRERLESSATFAETASYFPEQPPSGRFETGPVVKNSHNRGSSEQCPRLCLLVTTRESLCL